MLTNREKFIALVDNDCIQKSDAIVLLEGDGLNRYQKAVMLFNEKFADKIIFSGGITDYEYGSFPFSDVQPHILNTGVPHEAIIHEDKSLNTKEQAIEVIKLAIQNRWTKLILVATHEHQYRAYLTFLREVIDSGTNIVLYNAPVRNLGWFSETGWGLRFDRLEKEFDRIERYSDLGHLATFEEVIEYQKWKEKQV
ncbi:YdcF family protein [Daejeonella sp. H1SJ63]|uniref:YdcF family protein n=1 Tax=Daejeonella sp. H1SJ63 TaxID=3034145 RepID=UPI0023EDBA85|nr:YdcF family protein [Daejeonella sp. H1SJ63]